MESTSSIENTSAQPTHKLQLPKLSESISNLLNRVPLAQKFDLLFLISTLQKGRKLLYRFPTDFYKGSLNGDEPDIVLPRSEIGDQVDFYIEKFLESLNTFGTTGHRYANYTDTIIADLFLPKKNIHQNNPSVISVDDLKMYSLPICFENVTKEDEEPREQNQTATDDSLTRISITSFNLIVVYTGKEQCPIKNLKDYLSFFVRSLEFEEIMQRYLTTQVNQIFNENKDFNNAVRTQLKNEAFLKQIKGAKDLNRILREKINTITEEYTKKIDLFNLIESFFKSLITGDTFDFVIGSVNLRSFNLQRQADSYIKPSDIKPYMTIVMMRRHCLERLKVDSLNRFRLFIEKHNHHTSLYQMALEHNFEFEEVQVYSAHLKNCRMAIPINTLTNNSCFGLNPNVTKILTSTSLQKFDKSFELNMLEVLQAFSKPTRIEDYLKNNAFIRRNKGENASEKDLKQLYDIVVVLILQNLLIEYDYFVYLKAPNEDVLVESRKYQKSSDKKKIELGVTLEKLVPYSLQNKSVHQIAFENEISLKVIFRTFKEFPKLIDYYVCEKRFT